MLRQYLFPGPAPCPIVASTWHFRQPTVQSDLINESSSGASSFLEVLHPICSTADSSPWSCTFHVMILPDLLAPRVGEMGIHTQFLVGMLCWQVSKTFTLRSIVLVQLLHTGFLTIDNNLLTKGWGCLWGPLYLSTPCQLNL